MYSRVVVITTLELEPLEGVATSVEAEGGLSNPEAEEAGLCEAIVVVLSVLLSTKINSL